MKFSVYGTSYLNGNTGIGTTASLGNLKLAVKGSMAIGSTSFLANITTPLANGLMVEGKVGIGSPPSFPGNYNLYVTGGILTEKIKVAISSTNDWSDFVFNSNFSLRSLEELKMFVKKYKHLPNMPSCEEIMNDGGIDLGKMDALLLQNIEEQSLYIIGLQEQVNALKIEIEKLQKK